MDKVIYNTINAYYTILGKRGYHSYTDAVKLLVLCFYRDFLYNDYRGIISKEDYSVIEKALNCVFGSTCLIPYIDYLKMGKLHIGEITELSHRVSALEDTEVLKAFPAEGDAGSDVIILSSDDE